MIDRFHHLYIEPMDYEASLAFYRDVLGWSMTEEWVDEESSRGTILSGGGIKVVIAERKGGGEAVDGNEVARFKIHLDIHDVDARFKALPKGGHVEIEPENTSWGTRWFVVRDPDGNRIAFEEVHSRGS